MHCHGSNYNSTFSMEEIVSLNLQAGFNKNLDSKFLAIPKIKVHRSKYLKLRLNHLVKKFKLVVGRLFGNKETSRFSWWYDPVL